MKVVLGSRNLDKIKILENSLKEIDLVSEVVGVEVDSKITDQPLDKETTKEDAINRARNAKKVKPSADFWFGLEGGLCNQGEGLCLVTCACLIDKSGKEFIGEGEEIKLPEDVSQRVRKGEWFGTVIRKYAKDQEIDQNLITRLYPFTQAVQNAYAEYLKKYGKLGYRDKVSGVITNNNGKILMVQLTTYEENQWNFPGGGIEEGELEEEAILRELREELGTDKFELVRKSKHIEQYDWPPFAVIGRLKKEKRTWKGQRVRYFLIKFLGKDKDLKPDPGEIRKIKYVRKEELGDYLIFPNQMKIAERVLNELIR